MKIALVAPTHLPARRANTLQVMKMAQALACLGHDVRVCAPGKPSQPVQWAELASLYGLHKRFPVEWLPAHPSLRRYDYGVRALRWGHGWQADLIYTRLPQAAALASSLGMPTILEVHDLPQAGMGAWLFRRFLRGSGSRRLVAITRALRDDLTQRLGAPAEAPFTVVASDGVDLERYTNLPAAAQSRQELAARLQAPSFQPGRFTTGYTGHLYAGRGLEMILEMAVYLPQVNFLLVGGEPADVQRLQNQARSNGLGNVTLTGFLPNADLPRIHAACDVFLMPYQTHVAASSGGDIARYLSPMKLFEYMACGRPVLASDLPVIGEVLSSENAVLLPADDAQAWADALQRLQNDPQRCAYLGERVRREAAAYTWEKRAAKILEGL